MFRTRILSSAATLVLTSALSAAYAQAPAESILVVKVDVAGLVGSALYKQLTAKYGDKMASKDENYLKFKEATGLNPETDIKTMTLGIAGDLNQPNPPMYVVLEGNFDEAKIESYATSSGKLKMDKQAGLKTFTPTETSGSQPPPTFAIVNPTTLIAASPAEFVALANAAKSGGIPINAAVKTVLASDKGQIQIAMVLPESAKEQAKANPQMAALATVQTFVLSTVIGTDVEVALKASADNEANGKTVYDAFNGFLALGKMMSAEQPQAQKILNDLKIEQQGAITQLTLAVRAQDVVDLVGQAVAMAGTANSAAGEASPGTEEKPAAGTAEEEEESEEAPAEATPKP